MARILFIFLVLIFGTSAAGQETVGGDWQVNNPAPAKPPKRRSIKKVRVNKNAAKEVSQASPAPAPEKAIDGGAQSTVEMRIHRDLEKSPAYLQLKELVAKCNSGCQPFNVVTFVSPGEHIESCSTTGHSLNYFAIKCGDKVHTVKSSEFNKNANCVESVIKKLADKDGNGKKVKAAASCYGRLDKAFPRCESSDFAYFSVGCPAKDGGWRW